MTEFMKPRFSVASPGTQQYRDNWDAIFAKPCIYCSDRGFFGDELSGGESYCTCKAGEDLKASELLASTTPEPR